MAYQAGGRRDKQLRAGLIALGLGGALWLLTTPDPPPGAQSYPAAPDGHVQRVVAERNVALRSQPEVTGTQPWLLVTPEFNLVPGTQELPDTTRASPKRQYGDVAQPTANTLLYAAPEQAPLVVVDFPNPTRAARRVQPEVTSADLDLLTSPDANLTTAQQVFPDTTAAAKRQRPDDVGQPGAQQNLLLFIPAPEQAPLVVADLPNPQRVRARQPYVEQPGAQANLLLAPPYPLGVPEYPNPTLREWSPIQRTWVDSTLRLVGFDTLYGAPGQVPTYDWPNPRTPQRSIELRSWTQLSYLTALNPPAVTGVANAFYAYLYMDGSYAVPLKMADSLRANLSMDTAFYAHLEMM